MWKTIEAGILQWILRITMLYSNWYILVKWRAAMLPVKPVDALYLFWAATVDTALHHKVSYAGQRIQQAE